MPFDNTILFEDYPSSSLTMDDFSSQSSNSSSSQSSINMMSSQSLEEIDFSDPSCLMIDNIFDLQLQCIKQMMEKEKGTNQRRRKSSSRRRQKQKRQEELSLMISEEGQPSINNDDDVLMTKEYKRNRYADDRDVSSLSSRAPSRSSTRARDGKLSVSFSEVVTVRTFSNNI